MNILDINTKFASSSNLNSIMEIENKIVQNLDFWATDGIKVCIILKETKDIFYFQPVSNDKFEIFIMEDNKDFQLLSCGIYEKSKLKNIGKYLNGNVDRRVNNGVINDYLGE